MIDEEHGGGGQTKTVAALERRRTRLLSAAKIALLSIILMILAPFIVPSVNRVWAGLRYPYQMDSEEGFVLWQAWRLRHGRTIFRSLDSPPYVAATYAPAYLLMSAATLWGKRPSFFGGRLIAALSVAAICVFMGLITWRETHCAPAVFLAPLLFLNSYDVYQWLPYYRVDFTALAVGMVGLWLLGAQGELSRGRFRAVCACFVLMVYTKQVELAPFVAALIYFGFADRARAWPLFRNVAAWGVAIAAVLTLLTGGQYLVHNVYYNANPFSWWQLKTVVSRHLIVFHRFFIIASVVCLIWYLLERLRPYNEWQRGGRPLAKESPATENRTGSDSEEGSPCLPERSGAENAWGRTALFATYAAVSSIGILGLGKIGAATNYLIEPKAAWSLFIALVLGKTIGRANAMGGFRIRRPVFFPVAFVLLLHCGEFLCSSTLLPMARPILERNPEGPLARLFRNESVRHYLESRPQVLFARDNVNPTVADRLNGDRIVQVMSETKGPVFCEHAIFPMLSGHEVYIQPFVMKELSNEGKWDQTPVVEALRKGRFSLIQTTEDVFEEGFKFHYTDEMTAAIRAAYKLREVFRATRLRPAVFTQYILEPRGPRPDG